MGDKIIKALFMIAVIGTFFVGLGYIVIALGQSGAEEMSRW